MFLNYLVIGFVVASLACGRELEINTIGSDIACGDGRPLAISNYSQGFLISPGFDQFHFVPPNQECSWVLDAKPGMAWRLRFITYDLGECSESVLEIVDSVDRSISTLCGDEYPLGDIITKDPRTVIRFRSGPYTHFTGFRMFFQLSKPKVTCDDSEHITCRNHVSCVDKRKQCDQVNDCEDGTDEQKCPGTSSWVNCGLPPIRPALGNDRVVGGREAIPNSWPWQASIRLSRMEPLGHICGATLIHPQWLVTAAHCFRENPDKDYWEVHLGKHRKIIQDETEQIRYIEKIHIYPEYQGNERKPKQTWYERKAHDIALLKMNAPVTITPYVMPACLPEPDIEIKDDTQCHVTGWGFTQGKPVGVDYVLKQASVPLVSRESCQLMYPYYQIGESMLCAGYLQGGHDACSGDSGGPLVLLLAARWQLLGVVSTGGTCAAPKEPGIYTKVSKYVTWIRQTVEQKSNLDQA